MAQIGYSRWENFHTAINRAVDSCNSLGVNVDDPRKEQIAFAQSYFAVQLPFDLCNILVRQILEVRTLGDVLPCKLFSVVSRYRVYHVLVRLQRYALCRESLSSGRLFSFCLTQLSSQTSKVALSD